MRKLKFSLSSERFMKTLLYGLMSLLLVCIYIAVLYLEMIFAPSVPLVATLISFSFMVLLVYITARRFKPAIEDKVDKLLCPDSHVHRQALHEFSSRIGNSINLDGVANDILSTISNVLRAGKAVLLLRNGDCLVSQFNYPRSELETEGPLELKCDSQIAMWLAKEGRPLHLADLPDIPELKVLPAKEYADLAGLGSSLLIPIKGHEDLIGIIAAGDWQNGAFVPTKDMELAVEAARQAGIVIENAQLYSQAKNKANVDELTGLFNHRHFHERLHEEVSRSSRYGDIFSLLMIDLDGFKSYNDIHGHLHGDKILKKAGEIIRNNIRAIDVPARYGGDEFSAILPKSSIDSALRIASRLRNAVESEFNNESSPITCSVGVAVWPTDGLMKEALIHAADTALYQAKKMGRNRVYTASKLATLKVSEKSTDQESSNVVDTIYALAATVDAKDHYTYGHSNKVSKYACEIATELGYSEERIQVIKIAGLLHDIGKIGVSDDILGKKQSLDDSDWKPIHSHPEMGVSILRHVDSIKECLPGVLCHHEHYDGTGYPQGLKGENIPLEARILAVADSYDAMTSSRLYHENPHAPGWAVEELIRCSGTQFDPNVVNVFVKILAAKSRKNQKFEFTHTNL